VSPLPGSMPPTGRLRETLRVSRAASPRLTGPTPPYSGRPRPTRADPARLGPTPPDSGRPRPTRAGDFTLVTDAIRAVTDKGRYRHNVQHVETFGCISDSASLDARTPHDRFGDTVMIQRPLDLSGTSKGLGFSTSPHHSTAESLSRLRD